MVAGVCGAVSRVHGHGHWDTNLTINLAPQLIYVALIPPLPPHVFMACILHFQVRHCHVSRTKLSSRATCSASYRNQETKTVKYGIWLHQE
jgi:hypothetical protein